MAVNKSSLLLRQAPHFHISWTMEDDTSIVDREPEGSGSMAKFVHTTKTLHILSVH